ncbi:pentatricopeptide repeat-containing protein At3g22670, mitochondrial-like [Dioscorea cayenensis subsp. rotundata]|uniref:Pentatricopeptide repeat-containing protein At3g22670, mitochondrial-like n=1 Tax=Dioscorea cayennensis subsp. rotundata TaxID=55577 RepID=A0AB40BPR9_DIOCR|nr:pentatricopeptide repeat-containing protein At3g22670, mitochondrial-like [Dioscorea cayenensis subsp. rotundata]
MTVISDSDDDFVILAQSQSLVTSVNIRKANGFMTDVSKDPPCEIVDDDVDEISNVLKKRFSSPETWVDNQPEFNNKQFPKSYDMMVDILGKCKKFDLMLQFVEEMNHIGGLVSLSTMAKVIRRFSGARRWHDAIKSFYDLELFGVKKDCSALNKDFGNANAILTEMRSQGCLPTVVTYTIIMHSLGKMQIVRFEEMHRDGIRPNAITYSTLISAFCDYSQEEDAFKLIAKMGEIPCMPDVKTYHLLLKLCCKRKYTKLLMYLLVDMFEKDISLDPGTYTMLVQSLCQNGKTTTVMLVF